MLNTFVCVEVRILVEKWDVYEGYIFPSQSCKHTDWKRLPCLNTRLLVNKKFQISHYLYWNWCKRLSFMCSTRNDNYNPSYSKLLLSIESLLRTWFLCFSWLSFFAFGGAEKQVFHIVPFCSTRYVLKFFRCVEVSNRVRIWNKVKNIYVRSKHQLCQLETPIFIYKLKCHSSLINSVSFVFCEFNRVASWNEGKTIILVRS